MDAVEFLKGTYRMCNTFENCGKCPGSRRCFTDVVNGLCKPEKMVEIVERFSAEHPARTLQSVVLKLIPNAETDDDGVLTMRPCQIDTIVRDAALNGCHGRCSDCRRRYWLAEIKDAKD